MNCIVKIAYLTRCSQLGVKQGWVSAVNSLRSFPIHCCRSATRAKRRGEQCMLATKCATTLLRTQGQAGLSAKRPIPGGFDSDDSIYGAVDE